MSLSGFDQDYIADAGARPIHARPLGNLAAAMIGVSALMALAAALVFGASAPKPSSEDIVGALSPAPALATAADVSPVKQVFAFDLSAPEFAKEKKSVATRELENGLGREDSLMFGQFASSEPYLRLDLRQQTGERRVADFFLDLTRHAVGAGLSAIKIGQPSPLATRFGAFEAAEIRLSLANPEGVRAERSCVALRLSGAKAPLEIAGLACGAGAKPFDRRALGCLIDRLDYASVSGDAALETFFKSSDPERAKACGLAAAPSDEKSNWIEAHSRAPETKREIALPPKDTKKAR